MIGVGFLALVTLIMVVGAFVRSEQIKQANEKEKASNTSKEKAATQSRTERGRSGGYQEPAIREPAYREPDRQEDSPSAVATLWNSAMGMVCLLFCLAFYFIPSIIAVVRRHNNIAPILVVNFFLGWVLVGWVIALAWAFTDLKQLEDRKRSWL